jgi:plastocyanin
LQTIPAAAIGSGITTGSATTVRSSSRSALQTGESDLEIEAEHPHGEDEHRLELSTNEIDAGWTTITFDNETDDTHFVYLSKVPQAAIDGANEEGVDLLDYYVEHVTRPFQWFMDDVDPSRNPNEDDLSDKYSNPEEETIFPPWFQDVQPSGGVGLTSPDTTATTTLNLESGEYIAECYVKDRNGTSHSYLGMVDRLTVTGERTGEEPESTLDVSLSADGIELDGGIQAGQQTIRVTFEDQQTYDNLLGHDVHLIRLDEHTSVDDVTGWMNYLDPAQLVSDGTEPGTFLGGVQEIVTPALLGENGENGDGGDTGGQDDGEDGNGGDDGESDGEGNGEQDDGNGNTEQDDGTETVRAYFNVELNPGAYALVAEVPTPAESGMLETFSVTFEDGAVIDRNFGFPTMDATTLPSDLEPDHEVQMAAAPPSDGQPPFLFFEPAGIHVQSGDIVQFTAVSPDHTVTAFHPDIGHSRQIPEAAAPFSSPVLGQGGAWLYRFEEEGVYDVYCGPHFVLGMAMRIVVGDLAEEDIPEYAQTDESQAFREQFNQQLNQMSEQNENCEWPFVLPYEVLEADALATMNIQDAGTVPFSAVAENLGYEFQPPGGDNGEDNGEDDGGM